MLVGRKPDASEYALLYLLHTMLSIAKTALRPALTRAFARPGSVASVHTLPDLPYAYNVRSILGVVIESKGSQCHAGTRTPHLGANHEAAPHTASPSLRQRPQRRRKSVHRVDGRARKDCVAICAQV